MGDRFYRQQIQVLGTCPGASYRKSPRRKRMSEWTDELKSTIIKEYTAADPTPENSTEIIASLAEEYEKSPNGIRMILSKAGVYVKKAPPAAGSKASSGAAGGGRGGSKAANHARLKEVLGSLSVSVPDDVIEKLTGKAASAFADALEPLASK